MAKLFIVPTTDERKMLARADQIAEAGLSVDVHYHHAWVENEDMHLVRPECNEKCFTKGGDITESREPGLETK